MRRGVVGRSCRRGVAPGWIDGYACAVSAQLLLLQVVSDEIHFDGFSILRLSDITRLHSPTPHREFVELALKLRKLRRARAPHEEDGSSWAQARSANEGRPR